MPVAGAVIQQQHPAQSMKPYPHGLGPHTAAHISGPPSPVAPAVLLLPAAPAVLLLPPVPAVLLLPAAEVAPALPPLGVVSELHAARPTVDDAPVTTRT